MPGLKSNFVLLKNRGQNIAKPQIMTELDEDRRAVEPLGRELPIVGLSGNVVDPGLALGGFDGIGMYTLALERALERIGVKTRRIGAPVRRRLEEKLSDVHQKLSDLHRLEHELRLALRSCKRELRNQPAHCPILREKNKRKPESAE